MTSEEGKNVILKGWEKAGISDGIRMGMDNLPLLDPFQEIFPLDVLPTMPEENVIPLVKQRLHESKTTNKDRNNDSESDWGEENDNTRRYLDLFDDDEDV